MAPLVTYVWRSALSSQQWVAPLLVGLSVEAVLSATTGDVLPAYAGVAALVLFLGIWLSVVVANSEDPVQTSITVTSAGSFARVRLAKMLVAYAGALGLGLVGIAGPALATSSAVRPAQIGAGVAGVAIAALAGVAVGGLCARPVIRRTAWAVLLGVAVGLVDVVVPYGPPTRQLLQLFNAPRHLGLTLGLIGAETVLLSLLLVLVSVRLAWQRT